MFNSQVLEVGIGLILFYLLLSMGFTALNEIVSSLFARRSLDLKKGIQQLLQDNSKVKELYNHPLIKSLSKKGKKPSYIPSKTFTLALISTVADSITSCEEICDKLSADKNNPVSRQLIPLIESARGDMEKALKNVESWFDNSMERVTGWYKRWTMMITFWAALIVCIILNADTVMIAKLLWSDSGLRTAVNSAATATLGKPQLLQDSSLTNVDTTGTLFYAFQQMHSLNFPLGWIAKNDSTVNNLSSGSVIRSVKQLPSKDLFFWWFSKIIGILFTVLAIMLGAPFWFDVLSNFVKIRSAGVQKTGKAG